jgi:PIN domain nuclease of toxin-antitoxin system
MANLILDSDVMLNWLLQEEETMTSRELWAAPATILELGERRLLLNQLSLISMLEVRFVLRRKRKFDHIEIETDLRQLSGIVKVLVPTTSELEQAERLQSEETLDPFDSILLSQAIAANSHLISRDSALREVARKYIMASTPEEYIEQLI